MGRSRADQVIRAYRDGMAEMAPLHSLVRVCARYFKPDYNDLTTDPTESEIALPNTSAGINAQLKFVAGIYSNTISMGRGILDSADPAKRDMEAVKRFYGTVGEKTNDIVTSIFPRSYRETLDDLALSSIGVFYVHFDEDTNEHDVTPYNPNDCVWFEDSKGRPFKMYRGFEFTADQAVDRFGIDEVSEKIQKAWRDDSKANEKFDFIHCVRPRKNRDKLKKDTMNMPFESLYVEVDSKKIVEESGHNRFRYVVTVMLKRRGLRSGYSSAMQSLPSMRTLIRGTDDFFDAIEFRTQPAILIGNRESVDNLKGIAPGDVRFARMNEGQPFLYGENAEAGAVDAMNEKMREEINQLHFLDLFQALEQFKTGSRTAYEVAQIIAEKIHLIAPIIHPIKETFSALFEIIAEDIMQHGLVDVEVPEELAGDEFRVKYTSRIDARVSGIDTENMLFAIEEMANAENLMQGPNTLAIMKIEEVLRSIADKRNLNPDLTRTEKGYNDELARIAQEQADAMAAEANAAAAAKRDVKKAPEDGSEAQVIQDAIGQVR